MTSHFGRLVRTLCLCACLAAPQAGTSAADLPPAKLRELASHAARSETWTHLRSYAETQSGTEWSGWALFLAGYQEYHARRFGPAAQDLEQAFQTGFPLADYARYYQASALINSGQSPQAAEALQSFAVVFPQSHLLKQAGLLRANALLNSQQTQAVIDMLAADPETPHNPASSLLLAQAYAQIHHALEAKSAFQNVYYNFPFSPQAKAASDALGNLRQQLGSVFTAADIELQMARADALLKGGRYSDALQQFDTLLNAGHKTPLTPNWQLGRARCLFHLRRFADTLQALSIPFRIPELEAQRLSLLAQIHIQQGNTAALTRDLELLGNTYTPYPSYADALSAAGIYYYRQLNWREAAQNYQRLWDLFPQSEHLREDGWRLGWCDYLLGDPNAAPVLYKFLIGFPDAPRAPSALFWLARIEQAQGSPLEARSLYALLVQRFAHSYYAPLAAARMAALKTNQASLSGENGSPAAPLTAALLPDLAPPAVPRDLACTTVAPGGDAQSARILQALGLQDLEEGFLKSALAENHPPAELRVLLAEIYFSNKDYAGALFSALRAIPAYSQLDFPDLPQEVWNFLYPQEYWDIVQKEAQKNNLDPFLVMGLIRQESAFDAQAVSVANARGLMQLLPETAASVGRARARSVARRLYDPEYNIHVGCDYLASLLKEFNGQAEFALAAYNAGDFRVKNWISKAPLRDPELFLESIPIPATRGYVELVLRDASVYRQFLSGSPSFARCPPEAPPAAPGE